MPRGIFSGATFATIPSGVTIDPVGVNIGGDYALPFSTTSGIGVTAGYASWTGVTQNLLHGLSTLYFLEINLLVGGSAASEQNNYSARMLQNTVTTGVSYGIRGGASNALVGNGGTIYWMAIGS